ncbi:hypothetical protein COL922a_012848, partial [Colletotrichum nupharicola]
IESMMKYLDPKQSTLRDKQLHSYVTSVLETIDESVSVICEVRHDFDDWERVTANLLRALEDKAYIKGYTVKQREELVLDREMKEVSSNFQHLASRLSGQQKLQSDVLLMKTRFLIASKATSLYNEVSDRFVIPGVRWLRGLRLVGSTDDVFTDKVKKIEERGSRIGAETMHLICKRVDELGVEIEVLNRDFIESFAKFAPDIVQKMMGEAKEVEEEVVQS